VYASFETERVPTTKYINVGNRKKSKGGKFLVTQGNLASPGYPYEYPGGVSQTVFIVSPKNTNIQLNFQVCLF
jgi:hypothetical protein